MSEQSKQPVLLYDGVCGFCNQSVQTVIKYDRSGELKFAALQSAYGAEVIRRHPELEKVDSLMFVERLGDGSETVAVRSSGALRVAAYLGGWWKILLVAYLIPRPVRDFFYDLFARYRYRLFGKHESCMIPSPDVRSRFLDMG